MTNLQIGRKNWFLRWIIEQTGFFNRCTGFSVNLPIHVPILDIWYLLTRHTYERVKQNYLNASKLGYIDYDYTGELDHKGRGHLKTQ